MSFVIVKFKLMKKTNGDYFHMSFVLVLLSAISCTVTSLLYRLLLYTTEKSIHIINQLMNFLITKPILCP